MKLVHSAAPGPSTDEYLLLEALAGCIHIRHSQPNVPETNPKQSQPPHQQLVMVHPALLPMQDLPFTAANNQQPEPYTVDQSANLHSNATHCSKRSQAAYTSGTASPMCPKQTQNKASLLINNWLWYIPPFFQCRTCHSLLQTTSNLNHIP
jgi:hypothetical protein